MLPRDESRLSSGLEGEQDEHCDGECHQAEKLCGGETDPLPVRAPDKAAYVDTALIGARQHAADLGPRHPGEEFVSVAHGVGRSES